MAKNINSGDHIIVRAINIENDNIIFQGFDAEEVLSEAEKSGLEYIIDFDTNSSYSFIF